MIRHRIHLQGPCVSDNQLSPKAIGEVLRWLETVVTGAVNMAFQYRSQGRGRRPDWLRNAAELRLAGIGQEDDYAWIDIDAPTFVEAAEEYYRQPLLIGEQPRESDTGFDLLGDVFRDVSAKIRDSSKYDLQLLKRLQALKSAESWGVTSLSFHGGRLPSVSPTAANRQLGLIADELSRETPAPRHTRLMGTLDMIRASDSGFSLTLAGSERVFGIWLGNSRTCLSELWGKEVVVEGNSVFRPAGTLLRIEADAMDEAREEDKVFSLAPVADIVSTKRATKTQALRIGPAARLGQWPSDETDDSILDALREMN
jgi:hypothetical protein